MDIDITFHELTFIPVNNLVVEENSRKQFDANLITELANSIKTMGLINPITITPVNDDGEQFKIIAGERRYRACKEIGMMDIPCIVAEGSPEALRELQLVENCQRKDVTPIEELEAFANLISSGNTPKNIADNIGKSIKYVNIRLNLIKLNDRAKMLLFNGELNMSQCKYLVAMPENLQDEALDTLVYTDGMDRLKFKGSSAFNKFFLSKQTSKLSDATFDINDENLVKRTDIGACTGCKNNSAVNTVLFEEMSVDGFCANKECYTLKTNVNIDNNVIDFEEQGLEVVKVCENYDEELDSIHQYTKTTMEFLKEHDLELEMMAVIFKGHSQLGKFYPVLTKAQIKKVKKIQEAESKPETNESDQNRKAGKAIRRFSELVVSKIANNIMINDVLFTPGVHTLAMYKMYKALDKDKRRLFFTILTGKKTDECNDISFFTHQKHIEEKFEFAFTILSVIDLDPDFVDRDSYEFTLIQKLALEADVDIEECRNEIAKESGIDLSRV